MEIKTSAEIEERCILNHKNQTNKFFDDVAKEFKNKKWVALDDLLEEIKARDKRSADVEQFGALMQGLYFGLKE